MVDIYATTPGDTLTEEELGLYNLIMAYRAENDLPGIPLSNVLTTTAGRHAQDSLYNIWDAGLDLPDGANLHSWSDAPYFEDHRDPEVMWNAPERLGLEYPASGFEISAAGYSDGAQALAGWKTSPGHNDVILNQSVWSDNTWNAIGIGVEQDDAVEGPFGGNVYHVWFGQAVDPSGAPALPSTPVIPEAPVTPETPMVNVQTGGDGDDTFAATDGVDSFTGGAGFDTVTIDGTRAENASSPDTFDSIEALVFTDGQLRFDFDGNAGEMYRLYRAAYDRTPDTEGLSFWVGQRDGGMSVAEISDFFVSSPEFDTLYGGQNETQVVGGFYRNIFLREPDGGGFDFWVDILGRPEFDSSDLLSFFSESDEGKILVQPDIASGIVLDNLIG